MNGQAPSQPDFLHFGMTGPLLSPVFMDVEMAGPLLSPVFLDFGMKGLLLSPVFPGFWDDGAPYQPGAISHGLVGLCLNLALNTEHNLVRLRLN